MDVLESCPQANIQRTRNRKMPEQSEPVRPSNFIRDIIDEDNTTGKHGGRICTRFPPEPNGYLHIGHAKSICLNFGLAHDYRGKCHLRFDDTNPVKEDVEYVDSIMDSIRWLGFDWGKNLFYASDYYEQLYRFAVQLIEEGKAYVCDLTPEQVREYRGTLTQPGKDSPFRARSSEENRDLFERMRKGEFPDGSRVLRAKIDMTSPNLNMRDPVIYRILHTDHQRTGNKWCIYPMYDYAHPISDAIEEITHSICTLEFEDHRPLYDWCIRECHTSAKPRQIEFARLNMTYTVMSKRKLLQLVKENHVTGWDDPRMPTLAGLRRRGYTPGSIRAFCDAIGVAKANSTVDLALLENCLRDDLNKRAQRVMAVIHPLKVVIENYPEGRTEELVATNNPEDPTAGTRTVPFGRVIYIEKEDFKEEPPKGYFRLSPGKEIRLKYAFYIKCTSIVKDPGTSEITEVRCTYDPLTKGGTSSDGRKVKGTSHWVSAAHALPAEVRLYEHLFTRPDPEAEDADFLSNINRDSLTVLKSCLVEPFLANVAPGTNLQFERTGYFCADLADCKPGRLVFNRSVSLRDTWAKVEKKQR